MQLWATSGQDASGYIHEWLARGPGATMDATGGRVMGDTTTLYIIEAYEIYRETNDAAFVTESWSSIKRAIAWMVENALGNAAVRYFPCLQ